MQRDVDGGSFRLFDGVADAYLIGHADNRLAYANRRARRLLGAVAPHPGDDIPAMFDTPEALRDLLALARGSGDLTPIAATIRDGEGNNRKLLLEAAGLRVDAQSMLVIRCRPAADANEQFRSVNEALASEDELRRVQQVRRGLERAYEALDRFASVAAHDLKAPARHLSGIAAILTDSLGDRVHEEEAELLRLMNRSATRLHTLVDDIYEFATVVDGSMNTTPVNLSALMDEVKEDLSEDIADAGADIRVGRLPAVKGHEGQVRRLAQNLVQNAIKYREPTRPPQVTITATATEGGDLQVQFADNGQGFEPAFAEKIFEPFTRVSYDGTIEGSGLGLAACLAIASAHGWDISADSALGKGATFVVTVPASSIVR